MARLLHKINSAGSFLSGAVVLFVCFSISYAAIVRSLGARAPIWIPQFNEYAMVWITFLATAWVLAEDRHVSVDLLTSRLSPEARRIFRLAGEALSALLCAAMCYITALSTWENFREGTMDVQSIDVPKACIFVVIPFGFLLLFLVFVQRFVKHWRGESDKTKIQVDLM